ncbi:MAG: TIGR04083 family peptide-modifying radical SAM enzyme [Methanobacteriaceae archaeon]|nr:TIGR04083 family peptide-modifying radical SAM enzyme [Methanobacteriaceae archaeon]
MHLMIIPTMGCPSNCRYCWSSEVNSKIMSKDTMDNIVNWMKNFGTDPVTFTFHGGEPLLAGYDYFEYALKKISEELNFLHPAFAIQTNLWCMNSKIANLFKKYDIPIGSSLDGPKNINDIQRGNGYFDKTMNGYKIATDAGLSVSFISTFTSYSIKYKEDIFNFFKDNKLNMKLHPALSSIKDDNSEPCVLSPEDYGKLLCYLLDEYLDCADEVELKNLDHLCKGVFLNRGLVCTHVDCMGDTFAIGPDGNIYPCYRFVSMEDYVIGNVSDFPSMEELQKSKALLLLNEYKSFVDENCSDCKHIKYCRGGCPYNAITLSDGVVNRVDPHCEAYMKIFDEISSQLNSSLDFSFGFSNNETPYEKKHKFSVMDIALK